MMGDIPTPEEATRIVLAALHKESLSSDGLEKDREEGGTGLVRQKQAVSAPTAGQVRAGPAARFALMKR
jgi:hypothetical protein